MKRIMEKILGKQIVEKNKKGCIKKKYLCRYIGFSIGPNQIN